MDWNTTTKVAVGLLGLGVILAVLAGNTAAGVRNVSAIAALVTFAAAGVVLLKSFRK